MATDEVLPELIDALEKNFAELKIGEDRFEDNKTAVQFEVKKQDIVYQQRFSSENQTESIIVKPIKATKRTISKPLDVKDIEEEVVDEDTEISPKPTVVDSPSTSIGDDFAVDW